MSTLCQKEPGYYLCPPCERRRTKRLIQRPDKIQNAEKPLRKICRSCKKRFTYRTGTVSENLKKDLNTISMALHSLVKGGTIRGTAELVNVKPESVQRWLYRASIASEIIFNEITNEITPQLIQLDELWTYIYKKPKTTLEDESDSYTRDEWIWVAIAMPSRFIIAIHCGTRSQEDANTFVQKIFDKLKLDTIIWMTDGLHQYLNALVKCYEDFKTLTSSDNVNQYYGRVVKIRKDRRISEVYSEWVWGSNEETDPILQEIGQHSINTSYVERLNLTLRQEISKLHRKGLAFSKTKDGLERHLTWYTFYYNFLRTHRSLRVYQPKIITTGTKKWKNQTPAMAMGVTNRVWTIKEVLLTRIGKNISLIPTKMAIKIDHRVKNKINHNHKVQNQTKEKIKSKIAIHPIDKSNSNKTKEKDSINLQSLLSIGPFPILDITYTSGSGKKTQRKILPLELSQNNDRCYIKSYCFKRKDQRDFRVDRINTWKISFNEEEHSQIEVQKKKNDITPKITNNRKKKLKKHGNLHHSCCEQVLQKGNFVQKNQKDKNDNKNVFKGRISLTHKIETPEDFLKRMKDQIGLIIWQFLFFMYPSPQNRSDICEGTGIAWTTIYDTLVRLSEWNLVESKSISTGKRGRSKVYWALKESSLDVYEDLFGDQPPPSENKNE